MLFEIYKINRSHHRPGHGLRFNKHASHKNDEEYGQRLKLDAYMIYGCDFVYKTHHCLNLDSCWLTEIIILHEPFFSYGGTFSSSFSLGLSLQSTPVWSGKENIFFWEFFFSYSVLFNSFLVFLQLPYSCQENTRKQFLEVCKFSAQGALRCLLTLSKKPVV